MVSQETLEKASFSPVAANPYEKSFEVQSFPGRLEVFSSSGQSVSVIRSEAPDIEQWGFIDSGKQIVVRSQGNEVVILERFDTITGALLEKVVVSGNQKNQPSWTKDILN